MSVASPAVSQLHGQLSNQSQGLRKRGRPELYSVRHGAGGANGNLSGCPVAAVSPGVLRGLDLPKLVLDARRFARAAAQKGAGETKQREW